LARASRLFSARCVDEVVFWGMPHIWPCPNDRKNLVIGQNHTPWKDSLKREQFARQGNGRACRPLAIDNQAPVLVAQPVPQAAVEEFDRSAARAKDAFTEMYKRMLSKSASSPSHWAGMSLDENPRLERRLTESTFGLRAEPNTKAESVAIKGAFLTGVGFRSSAPYGGPKAATLGRPAGGFEESAPASWSCSPSGSRRALSTPGSDWSGRRSHQARGATDRLPDGVVGLPRHMLPYAETGQWLI